MKILIVENHPDTLKWLQILLEDMGHKVTGAETVAEARGKLNSQRFDILLSDVGLPDGTGWELLEQKLEHRPPFCVAISGLGMNADSARSRAAGFREHLLKPFKLAQLEKLLKEAETELASHP